MKLFYRISDHSYKKPKLPGTDKERCLMNFCSVFQDFIFKSEPDLMVIADRCDRKTSKLLLDAGLPVTFTDAGNAGSFRAAMDLALASPDDETVYFCEDDYLHLHVCPDLIKEISALTDYFTLYDHPDKYTAAYEGGETSKVIRTASSHWRFTKSTCMTFGCRVGALREDQEVWQTHTSGDHPWDHLIFSALQEKSRKLAVCLPGAACHTDLTHSASVNCLLIEPWAIDMMTAELGKIAGKVPENLLQGKSRWQRLLMLDAICKNKKGDL